jgi:hypothetical protein
MCGSELNKVSDILEYEAHAGVPDYFGWTGALKDKGSSAVHDRLHDGSAESFMFRNVHHVLALQDQRSDIRYSIFDAGCAAKSTNRDSHLVLVGTPGGNICSANHEECKSLVARGRLNRANQFKNLLVRGNLTEDSHDTTPLELGRGDARSDLLLRQRPRHYSQVLRKVVLLGKCFGRRYRTGTNSPNRADQLFA